MFSPLWDLSQQPQTTDAKPAAADAKRNSTGLADRVKDLEFALQRMVLLSQSLWELVRQRSGLTDDELREMIQEIDLRD
jgi:hypothetical protein